VFEIGSITKAVTGVLFGAALEAGTIELDGTIDSFFPDGSPRFQGISITHVDLATHTAGLPSFPNNMPDRSRPGAGYTAEHLAEFMATFELTSAPGTRALYSNLGAGVLGTVLVDVGGAADFASLVERDVAGPLGMNDTTIVLSPEQLERAAPGFRDGADAPPIELGEVLSGGGALRSTAADMLRFVEPALGDGPEAVVAAWRQTMEPRNPSPVGDNGQIGLLVNREDKNGREVFSKGGQTPGFSSELVWSTSPAIAVVILTNAGELGEDGPLKELGFDILDALAR
jgi:CubicO group peptidase (beta-lactamase class C family)